LILFIKEKQDNTNNIMAKQINYLNLKHFLSHDDLMKYFDKIEIFREFNAGEEKEYDGYGKVTVTKKGEPKIMIGERKNLNLSDAYMWHFKKIEDDKLDEIDKKFIADQSSGEKIELYGLHTYGGYWGFFRPDLTEVIHMLNTKISLDELNNIDRIYVSTIPYPSDNIYDCFDNKADKHRALTTCYIYKKDTDSEPPKKKRRIEKLINLIIT
jgi:hypothetical protein